MRQKLQLVLLSILVGALSGLSAAVFLHLLAMATSTRESYPFIMLGLPFIGLLIGWVYKDYGREAAPGTNLIIDEIHEPKSTLPFRMAPLILLSTLLTHLFGGSAGREGTAVQMGSSLADQIARYFRVDAGQRRNLLIAGAGASFGAAIGAPISGVIFGMEMIRIGRLRIVALVECAIASFTAYGTTLLLQPPHSIYAPIEFQNLNATNTIGVAIAGLAFGLAARGFIWLTHLIEKIEAKWISFSPLKPALAGGVLLFLYWLEGSYRFAGLGLPVIQEAFIQPAAWSDSFLKAGFTALTIGSGFKGGEFIPLVFIGTTLGSALASVLPVSFKLLAGVGFAAVFGAAANTPLACSIMAMELFGWSIAPYALLGCIVAYLVSGSRGIYKTQRR